MRRLLLSVAALAIPVSTASAISIGIAGPAGASAPVSCTKVVGVITGNITFKGCGGGLGKGTAPAASLATGGTITWLGRIKGTTTVALSVTSPGQGGCKKNSTEYDATGTVTADTTGVVSVGDPVSGRACLSPSGSISLVKHTVFTF
ncbi:MAG TPA: hypothetical protein VK277_01635 [Acidimicrobiales bacterium]|nr:hypothetical protein [Acidimicrobiales bacterium]